MPRSRLLSILLALLLYVLSYCPLFACKSEAEGVLAKSSISWLPVGIILDLNTTVGVEANTSISMALSDFYVTHPAYRTRIFPHVKHAEDVVGAGFAALELVKSEVEAEAIVGPLRSSQATFLIKLGEKAQVPIVSFSATSPLLSTTQHPFFIRTAQNDTHQVQAISSIVKKYGWHEVVLIHEDSEYGSGLIPYLTDAFQHIETRVSNRYVVSPNYDELTLSEGLNKLMAMQTRVFLVHTTSSIASKLFLLAKETGMMTEGYVWITTSGFSSLLDSIDKNVIDSMHGVLGVRPFVPKSTQLKDFERKWKEKSSSSKISIYGLWAYDTIWSLALAAEKAIAHSSITSSDQNNSLRVSKIGPRLLEMLLQTRFKGLSGEFELNGGQLIPSNFEIINVKGRKVQVIGYWNSEKGIYSPSSMDGSISPEWPGDTNCPPRGWAIPIGGKKLRVGIPVIPEDGYKEFVKIKWDPHTKRPINISGFSIDIFRSALKKLPFNVSYDFIPFVDGSGESAGTYDELVYQIKLNKLDAAVGDITIISNRTSYIDFTLPYTESSVVMVAKIKDDEKNNMWIFLKPLSWDLWLTIGAAIIVTGIVVWVMEHRANMDFRGTPQQQVGTIFWFSFSTLVFAHRERVMNNCSRLVLIIWTLVVLILTQSYTASLSSMLTARRIQPGVIDVEDLKRNGDFVGCLRDSFVGGFLVDQLKFNKSKIRYYTSIPEIHDALSRGSKNNGVAAIFDEIPYIRIFLARYCSEFTLVGPLYRTDGFGFAFPLGSPLVPYMSRAILNVTQDYKLMQDIEDRHLHIQKKCLYPGGSSINTASPSLSLYSFAGLFIITGVACLVSCSIHVIYHVYKRWLAFNAMHSDHQSPLGSKVFHFAKHSIKQYFIQKGQARDGGLGRAGSNVFPTANDEGGESSTRGGNFSDNSSSSNERRENVAGENSDEEIQITDNEHFMYGCA